MINFIKSFFNKYKTVNDNYDVYYNKIFNRYMYVKICDICNYKVYMFDKDEFKTHQIDCFKHHLGINKKISFR